MNTFRQVIGVIKGRKHATKRYNRCARVRDATPSVEPQIYTKFAEKSCEYTDNQTIEMPVPLLAKSPVARWWELLQPLFIGKQTDKYIERSL